MRTKLPVSTLVLVEIAASAPASATSELSPAIHPARVRGLTGRSAGPIHQKFTFL
ncbi:exported hypothetical protein [Candidatus Sulfotelmatobacter kueseliae]|uniref:Uncharacterized protein n=1 Tax=Candidatus Sulfotelmatobacter kueseliae TaxID=2042962 RepID=A0A2U3K582_9BACT|nr:exported hypothetical protein [Candidatus Sulfotelmatobacter kueseliae]